MNLTQIEKLAEAAEQAHKKLKDELQILDHELNEVARSHREEIQTALRLAKRTQATLANAIAESPELFEKPKTKIIHGLKVGFRKEVDSYEVPNEPHTIECIRESLPEASQKLLIKVEESVVKAALKQLTPEQLIEIGVVKIIGEDVPVCEMTEGDIDKLVKDLIKAAKSKGQDS